jgi:hypothetical protein
VPPAVVKVFLEKKNSKNFKGRKHLCVFENLTPCSTKNKKACRDVQGRAGTWLCQCPPGIIQLFFHEKIFEKI